MDERSQSSLEPEKPQDLPEGVFTDLAELPGDTFITEEALAKMMNRCRKTIKRSVQRRELPPSVSFIGQKGWIVDSILNHVKQRLQDAARALEDQKRRFDSYHP
ncbi:MAG: hypothetical protein P1V97_02700 [Planctomycetota bacterium]|nr:hypothetical protein [Planctomycetota bacterium]